jgi:polysaccharide export outer membrane protein
MTTAMAIIFVCGAGQVASVADGGTPRPLPTANVSSPPTGYVLGVADVLTVSAPDADELGTKPIRVENDGRISLPLVGRVEAAGLTPEQVEKAIAARLMAYVKDPHVTVGITEFGSQPLIISGAIANPGIQQARGTMRLLDVISAAGGLRPDAGYIIRITRDRTYGSLPVPNAKDDESGRFSTAEVSADPLLKGDDPQENLTMKPHDAIFVPFADVVYVLGEVHKAGSVVIHRRENLSALTAISMAEGITRTASPEHAKILRRLSGSLDRLEIPVNLRKLLAGKVQDVPMQRDDILLIPDSKAKRVTARAAEAALQVATGIAVFGR